MAGKVKDIRLVTFKDDYGRFTKGQHAMHKSLAEKLEARKAPVKVELAETFAQKLKEKRKEEVLKAKED